ncbi:MAG: RNA methyltransferase [Bacteroidales bacterium]|jgi:TrmH family RNA methyltransferase|nr:RNA methyltransferase [Bacteroidales bacterium]
MLSKNKIKFFNSIKKKKYRDINQCFFAEGEKLVDELLNSDLKIIEIYATSEWINLNEQQITKRNADVIEISENELNKISSLTTPNKVIVIAKQTCFDFNINEISKELNIFLENINDPGNLGTIIRIADWFGIENIFCSKESVDMYNPKVVQASMGAIYRTKIHYVDSVKFLTDIKSLENFNIYGTFLEGNNIYKEDLDKNGLIIMGSESHGISNTISSFINKKLFIPNYPIMKKTSESLNISTATSIVCSEFRRRIS